MEKIVASVQLDMNQCQFLVDHLSKASLPWVVTNGIISEIIRAGNEAAAPEAENAEGAES